MVQTCALAVLSLDILNSNQLQISILSLPNEVNLSQLLPKAVLLPNVQLLALSCFSASTLDIWNILIPTLISLYSFFASKVYL